MFICEIPATTLLIVPLFIVRFTKPNNGPSIVLIHRKQDNLAAGKLRESFVTRTQL